MAGFKDVVGRSDLVRYMENAIREKKISHAYILNGPKGAGKKYLAGLFAETLLCEKGGTDPCRQCHSCKQAESGNHPDIIRVTHEKPNTISVDDIREQINNTVQIKPYQSPYKIYIMDQADLMTVQAQNALLKTIEEPPEYAIFMLLTENAETLLPTINSRCVMLKLRNVKDSLIRKYLIESLGVPEFKAQMCAAFAQGNLGKAIMLASSEHFNEIRDEAIQLMKYIREMELHEVIRAVTNIQSYKVEITDYLDILMIWYRDVLIYKATKEVDKLVFRDQTSAIKDQAKSCTYEGIENVLEGLDKAKARLKANVNFDLVMELLFLTIKEN
ncbi:MAG: DNA polymerase III subunit delta' [Dorea sp.]|nr:DNA polymerase III subunit delta' [Dorea sp.]